MRKIDTIVIHCSASDHHSHDDVSVMRKWHLDKGWSDVGYHYFIKKDGTLQAGRDERKPGAHAKGFNATSIGICLHGLEEKNFTEDQFKTCAALINVLVDKYDIKTIIPHNFVNKHKSCPVFNVPKEIFRRM